MNDYTETERPTWETDPDWGNVTTVAVSTGVTTVGNYAFYNGTHISSVTISDAVTSLGAYAFQNCTSLASLTIPISLNAIGTDLSKP